MVTGFIILLADFIGKETAIVTTNLLYIPVTLAPVVVAIILALRFRSQGALGKAWLLFVSFTISWFIAEQLWMINELVLHIAPFPSDADFFYVAGYLLMFLFMIYYLKPIRTGISKKMIIYACLASLCLLVPSLYLSYLNNYDEKGFDFVLALTYPVLDAVLIAPAVIGIALFFRGKVNFMWTLISLGILSTAAGDTGFLVTELNGTYYTGHPIEIGLVWGYLFFAFGAYSHIKIFKKEPKNVYRNKESLR